MSKKKKKNVPKTDKIVFVFSKLSVQNNITEIEAFISKDRLSNVCDWLSEGQTLFTEKLLFWKVVGVALCSTRTRIKKGNDRGHRDKEKEKVSKPESQ